MPTNTDKKILLDNKPPDYKAEEVCANYDLRKIIFATVFDCIICVAVGHSMRIITLSTFLDITIKGNNLYEFRLLSWE